MPGIPPTPDIFDAPGATICINSEWASFIDAQVGRLLSRSLWEGTDGDIDRAVDQVQQFLTKLADVGACALTPIGATMMWWNLTPPDGWLMLDNTGYSKTDYPELFDLLGYTYGGSGDTFNLPDMDTFSPMGVGSFLALGATTGALAVSLTTAQMPAHDHDYADPGHVHTLTDPGHVHTLNDPGHIHTKILRGSGTAGGATNHVSAPTQTTLSSNWQTDSAVTGATVASASTGASVASHATGITFHSKGGNAPHSNIHPVRGCYFIIFAGH